MPSTDDHDEDSFIGEINAAKTLLPAFERFVVLSKFAVQTIL